MELFTVIIEECIDSFHDGERWGEWQETLSCELVCVCLDNPNGDFSVTIDSHYVLDFELSVGDTVFVVTVQYSTGNTFGRKSGVLTVEGIYLDKNEAERVVKIIENSNYRNGLYRKTFNKFPDWEGYFESVEMVSIQTMHISQKY